MTQLQRRPVFAGLEMRELLILGLYAAMLCFTLCYYQQSEDEGQAWIIARTYGLGHIFYLLRYLGHPALYYLLLWVPAHLGMPLTWINWPFAAIATFGIYLLLRYAPFPFALRALLPFGFALGYQYAVVARSYVLIPCLGFLVAHFYREKPFKPLHMAVCLALLANVSIHGTMIAAGFAAAYTLRLWQERRRTGLPPNVRRQILLGAALFAASILFVAICIWPAKYLNLSSTGTLRNVMRRALDPAQKTLSGRAAERTLQPVISPTASATLVSSTEDPEPQATLRGRLRFTLVYPVATSAVLAVLFELAVLALLIARRRLILILPFALVAYFLITVYEQWWHVELIWLTLVLVLWAAWDKDARPWTGLQGGVAIFFGLLCALQLPWTLGAIRYDMGHSSYPAKDAAAYLKSLPPGLKIDGNGLAFRLLPYFPNFIFVDHGTHRFFHMGEPPPPLQIADFNAEGADVILIRDADIQFWQWDELKRDGYSVKRVFCGAPYFPNRPIKPICLFALRK